jgi:hypothetical protein
VSEKPFSIGNDELKRNGQTRAECPRCGRKLSIIDSKPPMLQAVKCPQHGLMLVGISGKSVWKPTPKAQEGR